MKTYKAYHQSEIGMIEIIGTEKEILTAEFVKKVAATSEIPPLLKRCLEEIDEYFKGRRKEFSINLQLPGTDFQKKVWKELTKIPFGETVSYTDIAAAVGNKKAVRAVGYANAKNKISILIPCHRVIGRHGNLTGYGGGLWRKEWLLKHERKFRDK